MYLGAVLESKAKELTIPPELAAPNKKPVIAAQPFSEGILLLCQLWKRQEGVKAPDVSMKQAKYASFLFVRVSTVARIMKPIMVAPRANVMWNERSRKRSDERQMIRRMTVPTRKGGTVYIFVFTLEYPNLATN